MNQTRTTNKNNKIPSSMSSFNKVKNSQQNKAQNKTEQGLQGIKSEKQIKQYEAVAIKLGLMPKIQKGLTVRKQQNNTTKIAIKHNEVKSLKTCYMEQKQKQNISRQLSTAGSTRKSMNSAQSYDFANPFDQLVAKVSQPHHQLPNREQLNGILSKYLSETQSNTKNDDYFSRNSIGSEIEQYVDRTQVKLNQVLNKYGQLTNI